MPWAMATLGHWTNASKQYWANMRLPGLSLSANKISNSRIALISFFFHLQLKVLTTNN